MLGMFLGTLFIMAMVLIIYYKQVSEGYEDRRQFEIMQKVGMSQQEMKKVIRSQILMVFFLPLVAAGVHMAVAFPMIGNLLKAFNMKNTELYRNCTIGVYLGFAVLYILIYSLTAKAYYRIVNPEKLESCIDETNVCLFNNMKHTFAFCTDETREQKEEKEEERRCRFQRICL